MRRVELTGTPTEPREGAHVASEGDLARLSELHVEALASYRRAARGDLLVADDDFAGDGDFASLFSGSDAVLVGGWFHGALVGIGAARRSTGEDGRRSGSVTLLYVEPEAREVGVGESILEAIIAWCMANGCSGIDVLALPGDRATKSLLERGGFVARKIVMHRSLVPRP